MQTIPAASGGTLTAGETFTFSNTGGPDSQVTHCQPPLVEPDYHLPANGSCQATVSHTAAPGLYTYQLSPALELGNPKIRIISNAADAVPGEATKY